MWNGVDFVVVTDLVSSLPIALQRRPLHLHGSARPCGEVATQASAHLQTETLILTLKRHSCSCLL